MPFQYAGDHMSGEVVGTDRRQATGKCADRGPNGVDEVYVHGSSGKVANLHFPLKAAHPKRPRPSVTYLGGMEAQQLAEKVVERMYSHDPFSRWLGIERLRVGPGACSLRMRVREEMLNGFGIAHGGICYALADSALAFAANSHGTQAVSIETSITHTRPVNVNDVLMATAEEVNKGKRFATYHVRITDADGRAVALFKGTVFRNGLSWEL